jgi:mannose-1-phosphate guanylyltransferase
MRVILLAAGVGSRLKPLTTKIPKCLAPIKGIPLLRIWLERLVKANLGPFLINTHHLADQVESFIKDSPYCNQVKLVNEPTLRGTAATLISNLDFCENKDIMLIHADNYCLADLISFQEAHNHRPQECLMTMMTFRTTNPSLCGIVEVNDKNVVTAFYEKVTKPPGNLANGAVYILSADLLKIISKDLSYAKDFSTEILCHFVGRIYSYETTKLFLDIGTPEAYKKANM